MKLIKSSIPAVLFIGIAFLFMLIGCGESDEPVAPQAEETAALSVQIQVYPPGSLRDLETWSFWTTPVTVIFQSGEGGGGDEGNGGHSHSTRSNIPVFTLSKITDGEPDEQGELVGTAEVAGMQINMSIGKGLSTWSMHGDGDMEEHHAGEGSSHIEVEVLDAATGHHPHGGVTVSHCEVMLIAASPTDTFEIELKPAQTSHGYRYESNAALPYGTYTMQVKVEPPHFLRTEETKTRWTSDCEAEFAGFVFDSTFTRGAIGQAVVLVGQSQDSLMITLRGGGVKTYGAVGTGAIPLSGNETINFSVNLEDPTISAHGQPLYDAVVNVIVQNPESGKTAAGTLKSIYGHYGFYFGENMMLGPLGHIDGGDGHDDDGH